MITWMSADRAEVAAWARQHQLGRRFKRCQPSRLVQAIVASVPLFLGIDAALAHDLPVMPLAERNEDSIRQRWAAKEILESRLLDGMESTTHWEHHGFGGMTLSSEPVRHGAQSLTLVSPTKGERPGGTPGRPFGEARLIRRVAGENWGEVNRISFWVYPDLPGFRVVSLCLVLHNEGAEKVPGADHRHGRNFVLLKNQQWNQVHWEIAHLGRDRVTGVEFCYRLQGHEPGATDTVRYTFDQLLLERVEPDHYLGWEVAPGQLAYSHTGYPVGFSKVALGSDLAASGFLVVDLASDQAVFRGQVEELISPLGRYQVLDFSALDSPGVYRIESGTVRSRPFRIGADIWRETLIKTLNSFYAQRCGTAVPGIHDVCHRDWLCVHGERKIVINGGWHDAGDLSQGVVNTAEAVHAMFTLAERLLSTDVALSERLLEEAEWGLDWLLRTRFGEGYRCNWATMDFWTDGILGTVDDVTATAENRPFENLMAAGAQAVGARVLRAKDPVRAAYALKAAREDWDAARAHVPQAGLELDSAFLNTALDLHAVTGDPDYAEAAIAYAETVMACQQTAFPDWDLPMRGFFYTAPDHRRIQHYNHRSHEQAPVQGLVRLARLLPGHAHRPRWDAAIGLYVEYAKVAAEHTRPWRMLPASIYSVNESTREGFAEQVRNGVRLSEEHYLRRFPVWFDFRGNHGVLLSQTLGLAVAARYLEDRELLDLCQRQLQWVVGLNPFSQSTMYGEGYDFAPQYSAMSGDLVGGLPVGIQTRFEGDAPYWPAENCYNWKEIWVHPSTRWFGLMSELAK